jgi:hypothetical protein
MGEFSFTLPKGWLDSDHKLHRYGKMRTTNGQDEMEVQGHPQVMGNPDYGVFMMLSRVICQLGDLTAVTSQQLETLFLKDFDYLLDFYAEINQIEDNIVSEEFIIYPLDKLYQEAAFIAFYFHWSLDDILILEHQERLRWVTEIIKLKQNKV